MRALALTGRPPHARAVQQTRHYFATPLSPLPCTYSPVMDLTRPNAFLLFSSTSHSCERGRP